MKKHLLKLFKDLDKEFNFLNKHKENFPLKNSFHDKKNFDRYTNVLCGELSDGMVGCKIGFADDKKSLLSIQLSYKKLQDNEIKNNADKFLTVFRTALMMSYVIYKMHKLDKKIGLIGSGKINLMTIYILSVLGVKKIILIGGSNNACKNLNVFKGISKLDIKCDINKLKECEVLISCTNNSQKDKCFSVKDFPKTNLIIASDGGLCFSQNWRMKFVNFADYPEQLSKYFQDEFPWDSNTTKVKFLPITNLFKKKNVNAGVYLYGTILADLVTINYVDSHKSFYNKIINNYMKFYRIL